MLDSPGCRWCGVKATGSSGSGNRGGARVRLIVGVIAVGCEQVSLVCWALDEVRFSWRVASRCSS